MGVNLPTFGIRSVRAGSVMGLLVLSPRIAMNVLAPHQLIERFLLRLCRWTRLSGLANLSCIVTLGTGSGSSVFLWYKISFVESANLLVLLLEQGFMPYQKIASYTSCHWKHTCCKQARLSSPLVSVLSSNETCVDNRTIIPG